MFLFVRCLFIVNISDLIVLKILVFTQYFLLKSAWVHQAAPDILSGLICSVVIDMAAVHFRQSADMCRGTAGGI